MIGNPIKGPNLFP